MIVNILLIATLSAWSLDPSHVFVHCLQQTLHISSINIYVYTNILIALEGFLWTHVL